MKVTLLKFPTNDDWEEVHKAALVTVGKEPVKPWEIKKKHRMLVQRHSPIRELKVVFLLEDIPYWLSTELARHHEGCEKYIKSQRNDRRMDGTTDDRGERRQDAPVSMIFSLNAEAFMTLCNKRMCHLATTEAQYIVSMMAASLISNCPEFNGVCVPMCLYHGNKCHEEKGCGMCPYDGMGM